MLTNKEEIIIGKYFSGNATEEEITRLMSWVKASEQNQAEFDAMQKLWETSANLKKDNDYDVNMAWSQFEELKEQAPAKKTLVSNIWFRAAAAIALIVTFAFVIRFTLGDAQEAPKAVSVVTPVAPVEEPKNEEVTVALDTLQDQVLTAPETQTNGKVIKRRVKKANTPITTMVTVVTDDSAQIFVLPDNSIVYLNAHSKLEYPENFVKSLHTVTLTGEAFFEVTEDPELFTVACEKTVTRGRAASFNIRGNSEAPVEVIVVSGSAEFSGVGGKEYKKLSLKTGESATVDKSSAVMKQKHTRKNYKWWQKKSLRARIKQLFERLRNTLN